MVWDRRPSGDDTFDGGRGNDTFDGGRGNDFIKAGPGNDILDGGDGNGIGLTTGNGQRSQRNQCK